MSARTTLQSTAFKAGLFSVIAVLALLEVLLHEFYSKLSVSLQRRMDQQEEEMREVRAMQEQEREEEEQQRQQEQRGGDGRPHQD